MANYTGTGRTNTFRVKDAAAFAAFCDRYELNEFVGEGGVGFVCDADDGEPAIEILIEDEAEGDRVEEGDWIGDLAALLEEGSTCIFMHAGSEGEKYVVGYAIEVAAGVGEIRRVDLTDIYDGRDDEEVSRVGL